MKKGKFEIEKIISYRPGKKDSEKEITLSISKSFAFFYKVEVSCTRYKTEMHGHYTGPNKFWQS